MKKSLLCATWLLCMLGLVAGAYAQTCSPTTITATTNLSEDFNSYSGGASADYTRVGSEILPPCWNSIAAQPTSGYRPHLYKGTDYNSGGSTCIVMTSGSNAYGGNPNYVVMPGVTNDLSTLQLTFDVQTEHASNGTLYVGYMTDPTDVTTFTQVATIQSNKGSRAEREVTFASFPTTGTVYVAFKCENSSTWYSCTIDNVVLGKGADCPTPTNLAISEFQQLTVNNNTRFVCDFSWDDASNAGSYKYLWVPAGQTPDWTSRTVATTPLPDGNEVGPLDPNTTYDLYVMVNCTTGDGVTTPAKLTITTPCLPATLPYTENFEDMQAYSSMYDYNATINEMYIPSCWIMPSNTYVSYSSTYDCTSHIYSGSYSNYNNVLALVSGNSTTGGIAVLPELNGTLSAMEILFTAKAYSSSSGTFELGYYANGTFTSLQRISNLSTSEFVQYQYKLSDLTGIGSAPADARLAFRMKYTSNSSYYYMLVDDIAVRLVPDCASPTDLTAANVTASSATLSWTAGGDETSWFVAYGAPGFDPDNAVAQPVNDATMTINNLSSNADYEFYVKANCSGLTYWAGPYAFHTACAATSVPWSEDFEATTFPPSCWMTYHAAGSATSLWGRGTGSSNAHAGVGSATLPDQQSGNITMLVSPYTNIPAADTYQVSFWINRVSGSKPNEGVKVWVNTSPDTVGGTPLIHITRAYQYGDITETSAGWYQYTAPIPTSGDVYIVFEGISEWGAATYIDDIAIEEIPSCEKPTAVSVAPVDGNSATVAWTAGGTETSWRVKWSTPASSDSAIVTTNPYTITTLAPQTTYAVMVKAICGEGDESVYTDGVVCTTPCASITVTETTPYTEDFESYTASGYGSSANFSLANCWNNAGAANYGPNIYNGTNYCAPTSGSNAFAMYNVYYSSAHGTIAILPNFTNALEDLQVSFKYRMESSSSSQVMSIGYITNVADENTYHALVTLPVSTSTSEMNVILKTCGATLPAQANIAFKYYFSSSTTYVAWIDDIEVSLAPSCTEPANIAASEISTNAATITWTPTSGETTWKLAYGEEGFTPAQGTQVTDDSIQLTNLTPATTYDVYVKAICSSNDSTDWAGPVTFTTLCEPFVLTNNNVYLESFEGITSGVPGCWNNEEGTTTDASYKWTSYSTGYSGRGMRFNSTANPSGKNNFLKSAALDLTQVSSAELSFYYKNQSNGDFSVYISTDGGATHTTALSTNLTSDSEWELKTIDLTRFCGQGFGNVVIVFKSTSDYRSYYHYLDEVKVEPILPCVKPTNLAVNSVTDNSVVLSWTAGDSETSWNVRYIAAGDTNYVNGVTTKPYTLTGLLDNTTYTFDVQADCGETDGLSVFSTSVTAKTKCSVQSLPYEENFNYADGRVIATSYSQTTSDLPDCWDYVYNATPSSSYDYKPRLYAGTYSPTSGDTSFLMNASASTSYSYYANNAMMIFPRLTGDLKDMYLTFDYTQGNSTASDAVLQLGYLTDANDASTFTLITALPHMYYSNGGRSLNNEYYLSDYMEQSVTDGVLAFRLVAASTSTYWASVDNVKVMQAPACRQPNHIMATNITNNSAHLTWNANGNETGYLVSYHAVGGAPVDVMPITNEVDLTGLTAQTTYEVEIMAACGSDGQSTVSNIYTFTTLCDPFVVAAGHPFTENFNALNEGIPYCFDNSVGTTTTESHKWNASTDDAHSGNSIKFDSYSNPSGNTNVLRSQVLDLSQAEDGATLSFWCKYANTSTDTIKGRLDVYLYAGNDTIQLGKNIRNISSWTEFTYDISDYCGEGYNAVSVAFKGTSDYGYDNLFLDDIMVKANLPCHTPVANVSLVTNDAITYTWTALDNAVSYNIQYSDSLVAPGLGTIINTPNNSYTFSNLASGTVYYVYVQANCGVTDSLSEWTSVPVTGQTTTCGAQTITEAAPYIEDFTNYTANTSASVSGGAQFPTCWNLVYNGTTSSDYSAHVYNGSYTPIASNNAVIMTATASTSSYSAYGNDACVSMPAFTNDYADLLLEFTTSMSTSSTDAVLSVGYMTNPYDNGTFVALTTIPNNYYYNASTRRADHQIYLRDYSNIPSGVYLAFKWHSNSTSSYYCCIDNVNVSIAPTCLAPNTISATNLTSNSVDMSWTSRYGETSWFYQYGLAGYDPEDPNARIEGFFIDANSLPLHLEGLSSNTSYDFYLQSICGNDQSEYSDPYTFTTPCEAITITESSPYEEDFERYTASGYSTNAVFSLANCWSNAGAANYGPNIYNGTSWCRPTSGSNAFAMYSASSPKNGTIAILPGFTNPLSELQVSFKYMIESDNTTSQEMSLGYITDVNDENTYHPLVIIPIQNSAYVDMTVVLKEFRDSLPANANLAFKYYYNTSTAYVACIDDIEVSLGPACVAPNNMIAMNTTDSSTIITWTSRDVETQWEVAYGAEGFDLSEGTVTHSDTVTITGLTASTAYDVYVRALCSEEDQSEWFGPYTFVTACATQTLPYTEDFESYTASTSYSAYNESAASSWVIPSCWETNEIVLNGTYYTPHIYNGTSYRPSNGSKCLVMNQVHGNEPYSYVSLPLFQDLSNAQISFETAWENTTYGTLRLGYMFNGAFTSLFTVPANGYSSGYVNHTYNLDAVTIPAGARLTFTFVGAPNASTSYVITLDNIVISEIPDCETPSDLAVSNITTTTADVTWSTDTAIAAYLLTYRVQGDTATQITDTVVAVPYTISGLVSDARYEVSIIPVCDGLAFPSAPVAFTTLCPAQSLPYTENFETYVASTQYSSSVADTVARWQAPSCWTIESTKVGASFITPHVYEGGNYMPSGASKALVMASGTDNYAVLPPFDDLSNAQILFKTSMYSASSGTLNLGYMVNGTFTSLVRVPSNYYSNGYVQRQYDLDGYAIPAGARLAFKWSYSSSSTYFICLLDDIIVREIPTCLTPTNVTATNATDTSVLVSWLPTGDESQWEVACVPQGTQPTSGVLVDTINAEITGLTASTFYDVYVRAYCSAENQSYWTMTPVTFATDCGTLSLPYSEDFESYTGAVDVAALEGDDELDSWQMPLCWTTEETSYEYEEYDWYDDEYYYITYYSTPHIYNTGGEEGNALVLDNVNSLSDFAYAALPLFDDLSNAEILFATGMYDEDEGTLELGYMSNGTFTSFVTVPNNDYRDGFVEHVYDLSTYTIPADARLAFKWVAYDYSGYYDYYCLIDNVQVREKPDCETPSDLAVSNITSTTADVTWTVDTTVAAYVLTYHVQGDTAQMIDTVTAVPYTMTGLLSSSKYEVSVMPVCDGLAYPSDTVVFTTACDAMSLPYTEDFQSYQASSSVISLENSEFPLCWASINDNEAGYVPHVYNGTSFINSVASNKCLAMAVSATKGNVYAIMPAFTTELSRVELTFDYRLETTSESDVTLHVGYITDPSDYATYEELVQLPQQTGSYTTYSIDFSTYENIPANARIAFYAMGSGSTFYSAGIDNISLVPAPDCATPTDVVVNAGYNDATITWNEGEESAWTVYYHEAGDTNVITVTTTEPTVTISNLEPSTDYVVNVEVVCDGITRPTEDITFTTQCEPYTITVDAPYTEDFGSYTASSSYSNAGVMADCWNAIYSGSSAAYAPHVFKSSSNSPTANNKALSMVAAKNSTTYGQTNYVVLPAFTNPLGDLKISFATSMSTSDGQLSIGFLRDVNDVDTYASWEIIPTNLNSSNATRYASHDIYVYDYIEDYEITPGSRIAFRWENTANTSISVLGLDDIEVSLYQLYDTIAVSGCDSYTDAEGNVYTETTSLIESEEIGDFIYNHVNYIEINHSSSDTIYETACDSLVWGDTTIYTSGTYVQYLQSAAGCDSTITLNLVINNSVTTDIADSACLTYTWNNETYTESGDYVQQFTTQTGCDSIVTLHLTILHGTYEALSDQTCDTSYAWTWRNETMVYTTTGVYTRYATGDNGCEDTAVLNLVFYTPVVNEIFAQICEGETYALYNFNETEAGDYTQTGLTTVNGCDSTVILHLTVGDRAVTNLSDVICEGEDYTANGFNIIQPNPGIMTDSLLIARQGSCDSIVYLTLTVKAKTYGTDVVDACETFTWLDGQTYTSSIVGPTWTLVNAAGCDSIVTLDLRIHNVTVGDDYITACESYTWNNNVYTESGDYTDTLTSVYGCDSIVTLHLTVNHAATYTDVQSACETFTWIDGVTYTQSTNTPVWTIEGGAANGCDSIITLDLTINHAVVGFDSIVSCGAYTWSDGNTYTESTYGEHIIINLVSAAGCDSTSILYLTVLDPIIVYDTVNACETYTWIDGVTYTQDTVGAVYTYPSSDPELCDTTVILNLTITQNSYDTLHVQACDSYTWTSGNGRTYMTSRQVAYTLPTPAANGCDSILVLDLTINYTTYGTDVQATCDSFTWIDGITYTQSTNTPTYTLQSATGCDSIVTLDLTIYPYASRDTSAASCGAFTWNVTGQTYTESGDYSVSYTSSYGCDSTITLHLTVYEMPEVTITGNTEINAGESTTLTATENPDWNYSWSTGDRTASITVSPAQSVTYTVYVANGVCIANAAVTVNVVTGVDEYQSTIDRLFPNPADEYCTVEAQNMNVIRVFNMNGQMVADYRVDNVDSYRIETATYAPGVYFVRVITIDNKVLTTKFVVKH